MRNQNKRLSVSGQSLYGVGKADSDQFLLNLMVSSVRLNSLPGLIWSAFTIPLDIWARNEYIIFMIVFLQIPLTDVRQFISPRAQLLGKPLWASPEDLKDFVRSFGRIKKRGKGGVSGWVGENKVCDARHALRLGLFSPGYQYQAGKVTFRCADRHFFYDGNAVGKYEIVLISIPSVVRLQEAELEGLVSHLLGLPASIRFPGKRVEKGDLLSVRGPLSEFYLVSTSETKHAKELAGKKLILAGQPLVFCELSPKDEVVWSAKTRRTSLLKEGNLTLAQKTLLRNSRTVRVLTMQRHDNEENTRRGNRLLRMYMMRLHAEYESIRAVGSLIQKGTIQPYRDTPESGALHTYLQKRVRNISNAINRAEKINMDAETAGIEELAFQAVDQWDPGERTALIDNLKQYDVRPQVASAVVEKLDKLTENTGEVIAMAKKAYQTQSWEKIVVYLTGFLFIGLIAYLAIRNEPFTDPNFVVLIRIVLSVLLAAMGATIPGFLNVDLSKNGLAIRAGGALALFVLTYLLTPSVIQ